MIRASFLLNYRKKLFSKEINFSSFLNLILTWMVHCNENGFGKFKENLLRVCFSSSVGLMMIHTWCNPLVGKGYSIGLHFGVSSLDLPCPQMSWVFLKSGIALHQRSHFYLRPWRVQKTFLTIISLSILFILLHSAVAHDDNTFERFALFLAIF